MEKNKAGFTLIELIVVVAIIGVLATILMMNFGNSRVKANFSKTLSDMASISKAVEMYSSQYAAYPSEEADGKISSANFVKYMDTWPKSVCPNYNYVYSNNGYGVGVYLKYGVTAPAMVYYIGLKNFQACQFGGSPNCSTMGPVVRTSNPTLKVSNANKEGQFIPPVIVDQASAKPATVIKLPDSIYDDADKAFNCTDYKTYNSSAS